MNAIFPGLHAMRDMHPLFVHFPVACFMLAFVFQAVVVAARRQEWQKWPRCLLYLGALTALPTVVAGWIASDVVEKLPGYTAAMDKVETIHSTLMFIATGLGVLLAAGAFIKRKQPTRAVQGLLLLGLLLLVLLMALGADRGGQLVYQYGVGGQKMGTP